MPIRIQCPSPECRAACTASESVSGRQVKCPKCGGSYVATPTLDGRQGDTNKGGPLPNEDPFPALPAEFGRYRVLRLLGRGGMGAVYLARDTGLDREVALKLPFFGSGESSKRAERFVREARASAALHHPNICTVFDAGRIGGRAFLTMAFLEGTTLDAEIDPDAPMPEARAAEVARAVAVALEHAHRKGVVHRDLKPANVMLAAGGPVVMDFGLAKRVADADPAEAKLTRDGGVVGTPSYMSPEQVRGDQSAVGPATDVYALGVMLFEMLTGRTPYAGSLGVVLGQILAAPVPPLREFRPGADERLEAICRTAMAKKPADRFPSMAAVAEALDAYLAPAIDPHQGEVNVVLAESAPATAAAPVAQHSPFDDLASGPVAVRGRSTREGEDTHTPPAARTPGKPPWKRPAGIALAVLLPLVALAAATVLRVETADGTLIVEVDDPAFEARIKDGRVIVSGPDGKDRYTLSAGERDKRIAAGPYKVRVEGADGLALDTAEFTLKKGDKVTVRVTAAPLTVAKMDRPTSNPSQPRPDIEVKKDPPSDYADLAKGSWVAALPSQEEFNRLRDEKSFTGKPAKFVNGVLQYDAGRLFFPALQSRDAIVRARVKKVGTAKNVSLILRNSAGGHVVGWYDGGGVFGIGLLETGSPWKVLTSTKLAGNYDDFFELAFAGVGDKLTVYVDGRRILETRSEALSGVAGSIGVGGTGQGWVRDVEVQLLGASTDDKKFVSLFNGKDLTGWKTHPSQPGNWRVENGVLVGSGNATTHLFTDRDDFADFHLRVEARIGDGGDPGQYSGNSGVFARCSFGPTHPANDPQWLSGLNVKLDKRRTGGLILDPDSAPLRRDREPSAKPGEWLTLEVIARGPRTTVKVNGETTTDFTDPQARFARGHIALQQHTAKTRAEFRKIEVAELQPEGGAVSLVSPDRTAAEYVLSIGGAVRVNGSDIWIGESPKLPAQPFRLTWVAANENQKLTDDGLANLKGCNDIMALQFPGCKGFTDAGLAHLAQCAGVVELHLNDTGTTDAGLLQFKGRSELRTVLLARTGVTNAGVRQFKGRSAVRWLDLSGTKVDDEGLANFQECTGLYELELRQTAVTDKGLASFKDAVGLLGLGLGGTKVTDQGLEHFERCRALRVVDLAKTQVTGTGLVRFKNNSALRRLTIGGEGVTDRSIENLKHLIDLEHLAISHAQVKGEGLVHIKGLTKLVELRLDFNPLEDDHMVHLKPLSSLRNLGLNSTPVSDVGLRRVAATTSLHRIDLGNTGRITEQGLASFRKAAPGCEVWDR